MGLFDGIRNTLMSAQPMIYQDRKEAEKERLQLQNIGSIARNAALKILLNDNFQYKGNFNYGKSGYMIENDPYEVFDIKDRGEQIVACMIGYGGILGRKDVKIIFTDKAFYLAKLVRAQYESAKKRHRFSYDELCKYLVVLKDEKLILRNQECAVIILDTSVLGKNSDLIADAYMLNDIIISMQLESIKESEMAKKQRREIAEWLGSLLMRNVIEEGVNESAVAWLQQLKDDPVCGNMCRLHLVVGYIYSGNYFDLITEALQGWDVYSQKEEESLLDDFKKELDKYIGIINNPQFDVGIQNLDDINFSTLDLIPPGMGKELTDIGIKIVHRINKERTKIISYMAIRRNEEIMPREQIISEIMNMKVPTKDKQDCLTFYFFRQNAKMKLVYDCLKNNGNFKDEWLIYQDSYGLTPLHYSLILKNETMTNRILKKMKYHAAIDQEYLTDEGKYFSYVILAYIVGYEELIMKYLSDAPEIKVLKRSLVAVKSKMMVSAVAAATAENMVSN